MRTDVAKLYQAMDAFVIPSFYEGVPVVGVEAQFADLPCFFSSVVTKGVAFSENCQFIDLDRSAEEWATIIANAPHRNRKQNLYLDSCYRIENAIKVLEQHYEALINTEGLHVK